MSSDTILTVSGLKVSYGKSQVLFGVDLELNKGEVVALLGRNGAGKSTTFKGILGLVKPTAGKVDMLGRIFTGQPPHEIAKAGLGYVPEDRQVFPAQTVQDNLIIAAKPSVNGRTEWNLDTVYETFPIVARLKDRPAQLLSGGEQQLLTIARALMGNPDAILLDEPSEGLAPIIVQEIGKLIRLLEKKSVSLLLAEQNMRFCLSVARRVYILNKGSVVYHDSVEKLRQDREAIQKYLSV